jgi:hypothetical protein
MAAFLGAPAVLLFISKHAPACFAGRVSGVFRPFPATGVSNYPFPRKLRLSHKAALFFPSQPPRRSPNFLPPSTVFLPISPRKIARYRPSCQSPIIPPLPAPGVSKYPFSRKSHPRPFMTCLFYNHHRLPPPVSRCDPSGEAPDNQNPGTPVPPGKEYP